MLITKLLSEENKVPEHCLIDKKGGRVRHMQTKKSVFFFLKVYFFFYVFGTKKKKKKKKKNQPEKIFLFSLTSVQPNYRMLLQLDWPIMNQLHKS